jgi:glycosyltransferase involved in cell wall biosynthesis
LSKEKNIDHICYYVFFCFKVNIIGEPFENCSVDFEAKENIITYVGRLSKEKNIDHIIDIYNSSKLVNNFKLHIIGEGELREFLQKQFL